MSAVVDFLTGMGVDGGRRAVTDVLAMDDDAIESVHDFIQWLFPLAQRSGANPTAPMLTDDDVEAIQGSNMAQATLAAATDRMAVFYLRNGHWLTASDHNHLRITRIVKSLRLLRGDEDADRFLALILTRVRDAGGPVGRQTLAFWSRA